MRLYVERVEVGAVYEGIIYDFWVYARTEDGKRIKIFDDNKFNLTNKIASYLDALLFIFDTPNIHTEESITGVYVGEICVRDWAHISIDIQNKYHAISTNSGTFLFDFEENERNISIGETITLDVMRYDLVAYN
ncbi:hypothetical protein [Cohnella luojiensis]|uniref:Uncharacterized protein n=1 Tax=Cohnella luojiensis TaxID=652876 RepID=A0A4Y8LNW8_9BACL|nr:hypothetical protein [Cohnella luojiensis]TFE19274.1 hypothetical protein E2980_23620 [Cohnella luojiensis]